MEFGAAGTWKHRRKSCGAAKSSGRYSGRVLHLWYVLSIGADRCAGRGKGEDVR